MFLFFNFSKSSFSLGNRQEWLHSFRERVYNSCKPEISWGWKDVESGRSKSSLPGSRAPVFRGPALSPVSAAPSHPADPPAYCPVSPPLLQVVSERQGSPDWRPCPADSWEHSCLRYQRGVGAAGHAPCSGGSAGPASGGDPEVARGPGAAQRRRPEGVGAGRLAPSAVTRATCKATCAAIVAPGRGW